MRRVLQLPAIGTEGRFGNWMLHYLAGRILAEQAGAVVQTPPWIGEELFQLKDERITHPVPRMRPQEVGLAWEGVAALPPFFDIPHRILDPMITRANVQRIFRWQERFTRNGDCHPLVAVHVRRGDYLTDGFPIVCEDDLLAEVVRFGFNPAAVWWVSEDRPRRGGEPGNPEFLVDFFVLMNARNVFVYPRSTFSQLAALLGNGNIYMPYGYRNGHTPCRFELHDPAKPCFFETRNNNLV